jgi:hypothetical protein
LTEWAPVGANQILELWFLLSLRSQTLLSNLLMAMQHVFQILYISGGWWIHYRPTRWLQVESALFVLSIN